MKFLNEGLPLLDELVIRHPSKVEIRYLRLLSCYFLPRFLGRGDTVQEDARTLAVLLPESRTSFPPSLFADMVRFVSSIDSLTETERTPLQSMMDSLDKKPAASTVQSSKRP
jgi:hypothetical protein